MRVYAETQPVKTGCVSVKEIRAKERGEMEKRNLLERSLLALRGYFREAASLCSKDTGFPGRCGEQFVNEI